MAFESISDFFAMGNHGFYVWFAYGLTFVILGALSWHSVVDHRSTLRELAAQRKRAKQSGSAVGDKNAAAGEKMERPESDRVQT